MPFSSIRAFVPWLTRLGASGAAENAREAVEESARHERLFAELDERALRGGWARPAYSGSTEPSDASEVLPKSA
jgi:hypothetical protein